MESVSEQDETCTPDFDFSKESLSDLANLAEYYPEAKAELKRRMAAPDSQ